MNVIDVDSEILEGAKTGDALRDKPDSCRATLKLYERLIVPCMRLFYTPLGWELCFRHPSVQLCRSYNLPPFTERSKDLRRHGDCRRRLPSNPRWNKAIHEDLEGLFNLEKLHREIPLTRVTVMLQTVGQPRAILVFVHGYSDHCMSTWVLYVYGTMVANDESRQ